MRDSKKQKDDMGAVIFLEYLQTFNRAVKMLS